MSQYKAHTVYLLKGGYFVAVKIGHASIDERGKSRGGKAGDQTRKEIVVQDWYKRDWSAVFRAKNSSKAEKIALAMEDACGNNNIGYDQGQRTTLYEQAKTLNWNISKIKNKCECDCSSLVAVCVNAAGINISKDMYTGNQKKVLSSTSKFDILEDSKYLVKPDHLKRGDILLGNGHTAIVVSNSNSIAEIDTAKSFLASYAGTYRVTATSLNIRCGAGTNKAVLTIVPKGTKVTCYGYYTKQQEAVWLYLQLTHNGTKYTGFASSKYLSK